MDDDVTEEKNDVTAEKNDVTAEKNDVTADMVNVAKLANSVLLNAADSKQRDLSIAKVYEAINGDYFVCR